MTLLWFTLSASPASASSGEFTRAAANADWTQGSIAGFIAWTGCEKAAPPPNEEPEPPGEGESKTPLPPEMPYCRWTPYATVGPGTEASDCESDGRKLNSLGPEVELLWSEDERQGVGSASFDLPAILLSGVPGQLACLSVIEVAQTDQELPCMPPGEPLPPGWHCPYVHASSFRALASAPLERSPFDVSEPTTIARRQHRHGQCHRQRKRARHRKHHAASCGKRHRHWHNAQN